MAMQTIVKPAFARKSLLAFVLASLLPAAAHAHRSWLLPSSSHVEGKDPWVIVDAAVSENLFDADTIALKLDGLAITDPTGAIIQPDNVLNGRLRNSIDLKLAKPGTYRIALVGEGLQATYKLNGEAKRFRGTAETFAKEMPAGASDVQKTVTYSRNETFVSTGKPNEAALKPSNIGLELVPITHPTDLRAGEKASFRFLLDGKPAAKLGFSLIPGGVKYRGVLKEIRLVTDDKGEASLTWPEAGMYWLTASWPERAPMGEGQQPPRRLSYAATLEVLPQ